MPLAEMARQQKVIASQLADLGRLPRGMRVISLEDPALAADVAVTDLGSALVRHFQDQFEVTLPTREPTVTWQVLGESLPGSVSGRVENDRVVVENLSEDEATSVLMWAATFISHGADETDTAATTVVAGQRAARAAAVLWEAAPGQVSAVPRSRPAPAEEQAAQVARPERDL
jgi:hypothetical protein